MKDLTRYGECPKCGESCQPDFDSETETEIVEFTICCNCLIGWYYFREPDDKKESHYDVWEPMMIEDVSLWGILP